MVKSYKPSEIRKSLEKKGFKKKKGRQHHHKLTLYKDGKRTSIKTYVSHSNKEYDSYLQHQMKKQLKLTLSELHELLDCPMDYDKLIETLETKGVV